MVKKRCPARAWRANAPPMHAAIHPQHNNNHEHTTQQVMGRSKYTHDTAITNTLVEHVLH